MPDSGADWVFALGERINRLLAVEAAARAVLEAEGPSTAQQWTDFWDAVDHLRRVLDA